MTTSFTRRAALGGGMAAVSVASFGRPVVAQAKSEWSPSIGFAKNRIFEGQSGCDKVLEYIQQIDTQLKTYPKLGERDEWFVRKHDLLSKRYRRAKMASEEGQVAAREKFYDGLKTATAIGLSCMIGVAASYAAATASVPLIVGAGVLTVANAVYGVIDAQVQAVSKQDENKPIGDVIVEPLIATIGLASDLGDLWPEDEWGVIGIVPKGLSEKEEIFLKRLSNAVKVINLWSTLKDVVDVGAATLDWKLAQDTCDLLVQAYEKAKADYDKLIQNQTYYKAANWVALAQTKRALEEFHKNSTSINCIVPLITPPG